MLDKFIISIFFIALISCNSTTTNKETVEALSLKTDSIKLLNQRIDSLTGQIAGLKEDLHYWFSETEIDNIKTKGISNPEKYLINNLLYNTNIIPYKAVLGGIMRFGNVTLLGDRWAIADFDDGHIGGNLLLKYTIHKDSLIKWEVLEVYPQ